MFRGDGDLGAVKFHIGKNHARAQVALVPDNRITHVVEMGYLGLVEDDAVLELAGIAKHRAVANNHIFPDVAAAANLAAFSDPCRAFNHGALLDHSAAPNEHRAADEWFPDESTLYGGFEPELQIAADLLEGFPNVCDVLKEFAVIGMLERQITLGTKWGFFVCIHLTGNACDFLAILGVLQVPAKS